MPRFLKSKKILLFSLILIILAFSVIWKMFFVSVIILTILLIIGILFAANKFILRYSDKSHLLSPKRDIKKYNLMIIGDSLPSVDDYLESGGNAIDITCPIRSLDASYQILSHLTSLLEPNGICIITDKHHNKGYTLFDMPYLGLIAKKKLGLYNRNRLVPYPMLFHPITSFKWIFQIIFGSPKPINKYNKITCPDRRILELCDRKQFNLIYLT